MFQAVAHFFNSGDFMPHGHCFLWQPDILWLHVISDAGIAAAYFTIPLVLIYFARRRRDLPYRVVFWLFGAFILLCGTTHLMSIWVLWHPDYAVEGIIKALTAIASLATFVVIVKLLPSALMLATPEQLLALNQELQEANRKLKTLYEQTRDKNAKKIALLASIVESSEDPIISKSPDDIITTWNSAAERLFGYSAAEAVGQSNNLIIPADKREEEHYLLTCLREGKKFEHFETVRLTKSGKRVDVQLTISPIYGAERRIVGISKIVHDVTARKEAERKVQMAHKYIEDMLNHIPDPIFMKDRQHRWIGGNKAFWEIMQGPPEKFVGKSDYDFFPKEEADAFWEKDNKVFESGEVDISEEFFTDAQGKRHVFYTKKVAFRNDHRELFLVGVIRDITHLKEIEANLVSYTQALERSNKELDDFAYIASHDLKEPLRGIHNHARFLLEDNQDKLDPESVTRLERLMYLSQRMERLVNDLLYFSRLGRQDIAIQSTNVNALIDDIAGTLDVLLAERHARILVPRPLPTVVCDRLRIGEVFRNLITNAVKYNDKPEKTVEIGFMDSMAAAGGELRRNVFYVRDNGKGIAPEFHDEVFRIFKRLQVNDESEESGTGVGLTFVKKIIERHGGKIWLESEVGKGTTFYFTIG